ncbi:MAG: type II secretion system F family protein [Notoacmeibacter sp.]|nr:type II secretion system F family protein [Notoacmeibacter sp.]MCC0031872.1 type II secretion system F family protein [Brucellaceae bacterium]
MPAIETAYVVYAAAAITGILIAEAAFLVFAGQQDRKNSINRRLRLQDNKLTQKEVLIQLRKERGDTGKGGSFLSLGWLRRLRSQSGMVMPLGRLFMICFAVAIGWSVALTFLGVSPKLAVLAVPEVGLILPVMVLRFRRKSRHKAFGMQLPEALELITRSLRAGHPVPVAIALVAREMPDPIGTEFGIVADEITYGIDLVSALASMYDRVGHEDLPLFVTAVSIQSTTGGNLREILDGLSSTIRERGKLRRKVRAISTEGRMSAYILTAVPILLMGGIWLTNPSYYRNVIHEELTWYLLGGAAAWLGLGNVVMSKMSNFKF